MLKKSLAISAFAVLASCASLSEDACRSGDWAAIGYNDGTNGRLETYITEHRKACGEFGIVPDTATWLRARLEGLKQYCTVPNAYLIGRSGRELNPVCSSQINALQLSNFYGLRYYEITAEINALEDEISSLERIIATTLSGVLTPEQEELKFFYLSQIREYKRRIRELKWERRKYDQAPS